MQWLAVTAELLWFSLIRSGGTDASDFTPFYTGWTIVADGRGALPEEST